MLWYGFYIDLIWHEVPNVLSILSGIDSKGLIRLIKIARRGIYTKHRGI
jgi:hypothetical protein